MKTFIYHMSGLVKIRAKNDDEALEQLTDEKIAENMEIDEVEEE